MPSKPQILFAWPELPDYAARCIRGVIDSGFAKVSVIATKPSVPITGMEESLGQPVHWIKEDERLSDWTVKPDILFVGGYKIPAFNHLARKCRNDDIPVILMSDNNWQGSFRQRFLHPIRHRILLRRHYSGVFVPGRSGARFAQNMGYPKDMIRTGLYGSDKELFTPGPAMATRSKTFQFVGQFISRKNVLGLVCAFHRFSNDHPEWALRLCGSGPQKDEIEPHPRIIIENFVQPTDLVKRFHDSRVLFLPSLIEHWGLVVHEAALSGCALSVSSVVGAADDLAGNFNSVIFKPSNVDDIESAMRAFARWDDTQWDKANEQSLQLGAIFGPHHFASSVEAFCRDNDF